MFMAVPYGLLADKYEFLIPLKFHSQYFAI